MHALCCACCACRPRRRRRRRRVTGKSRRPRQRATAIGAPPHGTQRASEHGCVWAATARTHSRGDAAGSAAAHERWPTRPRLAQRGAAGARCWSHRIDADCAAARRRPAVSAVPRQHHGTRSTAPPSLSAASRLAGLMTSRPPLNAHSRRLTAARRRVAADPCTQLCLRLPSAAQPEGGTQSCRSTEIYPGQPLHTAMEDLPVAALLRYLMLICAAMLRATTPPVGACCGACSQSLKLKRQLPLRRMRGGTRRRGPSTREDKKEGSGQRSCAAQGLPTMLDEVLSAARQRGREAVALLRAAQHSAHSPHFGARRSHRVGAACGRTSCL